MIEGSKQLHHNLTSGQILVVRLVRITRLVSGALKPNKIWDFECLHSYGENLPRAYMSHGVNRICVFARHFEVNKLHLQ